MLSILTFKRLLTKIVNKLTAHGLSGDILSWIGEWLQDRQQRMV